MMANERKKSVRKRFRDDVFSRSGYRCECCGVEGYDRQEESLEGKFPLDAHHITPRKEMPGGGYVKQNGVSVCDDCHLKAENGEISPEELYNKIGSSYNEAVRASEAL